jgi:[protein-PII] uridylyltransferase
MILRRTHRRPGRDRGHGLTGEHRLQVEQRVASARSLLVDEDDDRTLQRIAGAPPGYLLVHSSSVIVRHCEMLEPLPSPGETRVVVTPTATPGRWNLDVATFDRPGLLAAFTGVLHREGIDVTQAVLATWDDGGALQSFVVRAERAPEPGALEGAFAASLDADVLVAPITGAEVTFDHSASPLYTACEVTAHDEPGLLHAIAGTMAAAGVDIHAARVTTVDGVASDYFDLSDRQGNKLDRARENAIVEGLCGLVTT